MTTIRTAEEKLAEFRSKRDNKESLSSKLVGVFKSSGSDRQNTAKRNKETQSLHYDNKNDEHDSTDNNTSDAIATPESHQTHWVVLILKVTLWGILWALFIEIQFGAVYMMISLFYLVYKNTRTGPRVAGAPSAYSVFNANCESIDGTLDPDQFDKEIRMGPMAVKKSQ